MKLKDKVKPAIPPMEGGVYMAVCVTVADLGDQYSEKYKNTQHKVVFSFDIPSETVEMDGETRPRQLSKRCTFSVSKRGTLRTDGTTSKQTHTIEDGAFFFVLQMGRECGYMPNILRQILVEAFG